MDRKPPLNLPPALFLEKYNLHPVAKVTCLTLSQNEFKANHTAKYVQAKCETETRALKQCLEFYEQE